MTDQDRSEFPFSPIEDLIADIAAGKMVIVVDDADRENEGDLVAAAGSVTAETINFMITHGRGLICCPITTDAASRLGLRSMVRRNTEHFGTDFTVAVDSASGITTGISASDRARTIRVLADPLSEPSDLV